MQTAIVVAILAALIGKSECQNCGPGQIASYDATETHVVCIQKITCKYNSECPSGQFCCPYQNVCLVQRAESSGYGSDYAPPAPSYVAPSYQPTPQRNPIYKSEPVYQPQPASYNGGYDQSYQPQASYYMPPPPYYQPQQNYYQPQQQNYYPPQQPNYNNYNGYRY